MLGIVPSYHCMQFEEKVMESKLRKGKKHHFRYSFGLFGQNLDPNFFFVNLLPLDIRHCCKVLL